MFMFHAGTVRYVCWCMLLVLVTGSRVDAEGAGLPLKPRELYHWDSAPDLPRCTVSVR